MTIEEARSLFTDVVFVHMPGVFTWLKNNSPKPEQTLMVWCKVLEPVEPDEAKRVIQKWTNGELIPPTGYAIEGIAIELKSAVMQHRYQSSKHLVRDEINRTETAKRAPVAMTPFFKRIMENGELLKRGEISMEQAVSRNQQILMEFEELCKPKTNRS